MKNTLLIFAAILFLGSCKKGDLLENDQANLSNSLAAIKTAVDNLPKESLEEDEKQRILFIREEEKLAYDVYKTMFDKYGVNIFQNILFLMFQVLSLQLKMFQEDLISKDTGFL